MLSGVFRGRLRGKGLSALALACLMGSGFTPPGLMAWGMKLRPPEEEILYRVQPLPTATLHIVTVPRRGYRVLPQVVEGLETIEGFHKRHGGLVLLNGGFFDPANRQTTSYVVLNGNPVADPRSNPRLMESAALKPYLDAILNRSEFRTYQCGAASVEYAIAPHSAPLPPGCSLLGSLGAGPALLPTDTTAAEAFVDPAVGRDPLGVQHRNARSGVGLTADGRVILVMAAQTQASGSGVSLPQLAEALKSLGAVQALALDGGSSSSLWVEGKALYGKRHKSGDGVRRPVKSVLQVIASP